MKSTTPININIETKHLSENQKENARSFFNSVDNPYQFNIGDLTVKINFIGNRSFTDAFASAIVQTEFTA